MLHGRYGAPGSKEHRAGDMLRVLHIRYGRYGLAASWVTGVMHRSRPLPPDKTECIWVF